MSNENWGRGVKAAREAVTLAVEVQIFSFPCR